MSVENMNEAVNEVSTPDTQTQVEPMAQSEPVAETTPERMYSKAEVIDLMKRRVNRSHNSFFKRYGVKDLQELDAKFNSGKQLQDDYLGLQNRNAELVREVAFLKNNINPDKYDDVITYFKGKGLEFSEQELINQIMNHPEWLKSMPTPQPQTATIKTLGSEAHVVNSKPNEKELASKLLGVKL